MAKLGSLYALSEDFIDKAILSTPSAASLDKDVETKVSNEEEPSSTARVVGSEGEQGMTCLTCGIGTVSFLPQDCQLYYPNLYEDMFNMQTSMLPLH